MSCDVIETWQCRMIETLALRARTIALEHYVRAAVNTVHLKIRCILCKRRRKDFRTVPPPSTHCKVHHSLMISLILLKIEARYRFLSVSCPS